MKGIQVGLEQGGVQFDGDVAARADAAVVGQADFLRDSDVQGQVVWADHDSFGADDITYKDRDTGDYRTVPFTPEHIAEAVVPLSDDFHAFLVDLAYDRLKIRLDELD